MTTLDGFDPIAEVTADDRSRIAFGRAGVRPSSRYAVFAGPDGSLLLTPLASIPARELLVWENAELRASLYRGLAEAAEGQAQPMDWVTDDPTLDDE